MHIVREYFVLTYYLLNCLLEKQMQTSIVLYKIGLGTAFIVTGLPTLGFLLKTSIVYVRYVHVNPC